MSSNLAIKVENISKKYIIGHQKSADLRSSFSNKIKGIFGDDKSYESFWALKDINFEIKKGEAVGIIGRNGAGKSTLLKVLSRITEPTSGKFEINGRVSSLLEVGTGFHPELSGRENIYLNGTILGMKRAEIKSKFDEIVEFSGISHFLDTPVKHYSSGMKVRLAFSVAAHLEPEILIVDEVLAVGDAEFQKKCLGKMDQVSKKEGKTVLFVSHNMSAIKNLCEKGILLNSGQIAEKNDIEDVLNNYLNLHTAKAFERNIGYESKFLEECTLLNKSRNVKDRFFMGDKFEFRFKVKNDNKVDRFHIGFFIKDINQNKVCALSTGMKGVYFENNNNNRSIIFSINHLPLVEGTYFIDISITSVEETRRLEFLENIASFSIDQYDVYNSGVKLNSHLGSFFIDFDLLKE